MTAPNSRRGSLRRLLTSLALCIAASASHAGSWQQNLAIGGFDKVHIYTPDSNSAIGDGKALLILLHGCVQPIDNYLGANLESAAEEYGMVVAVPDAMHKAGYSCWSYWTGTRSRSTGDYKNLITLANTLSGDPAWEIDDDQVYIAGLSSGASFANTTACLAPDIFAGVGVSAGPSIGTSANGAIGPCETADVAARCNSYAGSYASHFATQIASIAQGTSDTTVNACYNEQNAEGMAGVYGVSQLSGTNTISEGELTAEETLWQDGRVSMLWLNNAPHAWSGGAGASGSYISAASINYASYLGRFFRDNNQRVDRNTGPLVSDVTISTSGDRILVSGTATDAEGSVSAVTATFSDIATGSETSSSGNLDGNFFSLTSVALMDGLYAVTVIATDNDGAAGPAYSDTVRLGPEPAPSAPELSEISAQPSGRCVTVSGTVVDENRDLDSVVVTFSNGDASASVVATVFSGEGCDLSGGDQSAVVTATDLTGLSDTASVSFTIDTGVTATLDSHIAAGRLGYTNYADCYLEYGLEPFRLDEHGVDGGQCQWRDSDASCAGPHTNCSGDGDGDNNGSCSEQSAYNYYHKTAGRAYSTYASTGNPLTPDYFASGSDDPMPGSTWGLNTLHSNDGSIWQLGACP